MEVVVRLQNQENCASITCMIQTEINHTPPMNKTPTRMVYPAVCA
jgi:hypothetical protein